jgi:hypothetical protein
MKYLYFLLLFCSTLIAQEINIAKDTLQMREVVIKEDFSKFRDAKVKIRGECMNPESLITYTEIVTLVEKPAPGLSGIYQFLFQSAALYVLYFRF